MVRNYIAPKQDLNRVKKTSWLTNTNTGELNKSYLLSAGFMITSKKSSFIPESFSCALNDHRGCKNDVLYTASYLILSFFEKEKTAFRFVLVVIIPKLVAEKQ
ncbi:MAG: hypothetical protein HC905_12335 [Bacteroidales bacterium]|nr:hypothetical protein [Bacteroidales bacterium]